MILSMCSVHAEAQDLKSVLTGVAKAVIGNKATTAHSIVGTWTYQAPECQFESDQLLAKAGGEIAAKRSGRKNCRQYMIRLVWLVLSIFSRRMVLIHIY